MTGLTTKNRTMLRVLSGETLATPPVWLMRQAGRYLPEYRKVRQSAGTFLDLCYNPDLATEVTLQPIRRFDFDAAILFSDILVIPDGLGIPVRFEEGVGPVLEPVQVADDLKMLSLQRVPERCAPVYAAVKQLRAELPDEKTLIGFAGGPWTVATYAVEGGSSKNFETIKQWIWRDPDGFQALINLITEATVGHLCRQIEAGADCVQLFESWAGALAEPEFRRFVIEPNRKIVAGVRKAHPDTPILGFPRAAGRMIEDYVTQTGVSAVSLDTGVPMIQAKALQKTLPVQGNLDPILLVNGGAAMARRVREIWTGLAGGPHIFNLGHGIIPQTPPDNVAALVDMIRGG